MRVRSKQILGNQIRQFKARAKNEDGQQIPPQL